MDRQHPFDDIERFFDQISSQFEQFEPGTQFGGSIAVDVADLGDAFEVTADVPGYRSDDIEVTLPDPQTIRITASQTSETESREEGDRRYLRRERHQQSVSRTVSLPEALAENEAEADIENGVLTVRLPKAAGGQGTDIPVN